MLKISSHKGLHIHAQTTCIFRGKKGVVEVQPILQLRLFHTVQTRKMAPNCVVCLDDEAEIRFECRSQDCRYRLCSGCMLDALSDLTGQNNRVCPMCKAPTALEMALAQIGKGGLLAVERELRPRVEHQVRTELDMKANREKAGSEISERARTLYNKLAESLNLRCPRCNLVFDEYEGCNALKCDCGARFCAICLQDCGVDAHPHVREKHGNLFDKEKFYRSRDVRAQNLTQDFLNRLRSEGEPFELVQMVQNYTLMNKRSARVEQGINMAGIFVRQASADLERMICSDRKSILRDDDSNWMVTGISRQHVSPRCIIPDDIFVWLTPVIGENGEDAFKIEISVLIGNVRRSCAQPDDLRDLMTEGTIPTVSCVLNLQQGLRCAVLALEGEKTLYQTGFTKALSPTTMEINFFKVRQDGTKDSHPSQLGIRHKARILAINSNQRLSLLQDHIEKNVQEEALPQPLQHLIGIGDPLPVLNSITATLEGSLGKLNKEQLSVAHPLNLKTAGEVAGPPGTGKTQVITALVRSLIACSDKGMVVLSERNGAIDAIAEKFFSACAKKRDGQVEVTDLELWRNVLTFGAADAMGTNTKEFLISEKMK